MPQVQIRRLIFCVAIVICFLPLGCGKKTKVTPISAQVLLNDKPIEGALVLLFPDEEPKPNKEPIIPAARTQADGSFRLSSLKTNDGAPAGNYKVVVIWPKKTGRSDRRGEEEEGDRLEGRYATPSITPLTAVIKGGTIDPPVFNLK